MSRLLVVTAVAAERDALCRGAGDTVDLALGPYVGRDTGSVTVLVGGVGPAAAAAATATALALTRYDLVVSAGVAGGFVGQASIGDVVVADRCTAADLGAGSPAGFLPLSSLGFGDETVLTDTSPAGALRAAGLDVRVGTVLTVSTVTGTAERADELASRGAPLAEAMEGYGVASAAAAFGIPVAEIRSVSNLVGERDRERWDLPRAFDVLAAVGAVLLSGNVPASPRAADIGKGAT